MLKEYYLDEYGFSFDRENDYADIYVIFNGITIKIETTADTAPHIHDIMDEILEKLAETGNISRR